MIDIQQALHSKDLIVVEARVTFRTTDAGGRKGQVFSGYRPNHRFKPKANVSSFYIGEVQFGHKTAIFPGEMEAVTIIFLRAGGIEKYLVPGEQWLIQEGSRIVGEGEILNVQNGS